MILERGSPSFHLFLSMKRGGVPPPRLDQRPSTVKGSVGGPIECPHIHLSWSTCAGHHAQPHSDPGCNSAPPDGLHAGRATSFRTAGCDLQPRYKWQSVNASKNKILILSI